MRYRELGLGFVEIEVEPYKFLISRNKPIAYRIMGDDTHVWRSDRLGGKDVKAHTRHLNLWASGADIVSHVSQRHIDELFTEIRAGKAHLNGSGVGKREERRSGERRGDLMQPGSHVSERRSGGRRSDDQGEGDE